MALYNVSDLIGKTMIASRDSVSNTYDSDNAPIYAKYKKGDTIGIVYSWLKKNGDTWLHFTNASGKNWYFNLAQKAIDSSAISQQGVLTAQQKIDEAKEKEKDYFSRIYDGIFNLALLAAAAYLIRSFILKEGK